MSSVFKAFLILALVAFSVLPYQTAYAEGAEASAESIGPSSEALGPSTEGSSAISAELAPMIEDLNMYAMLGIISWETVGITVAVTTVVAITGGAIYGWKVYQTRHQYALARASARLALAERDPAPITNGNKELKAAAQVQLAALKKAGLKTDYNESQLAAMIVLQSYNLDAQPK